MDLITTIDPEEMQVAIDGAEALKNSVSKEMIMNFVDFIRKDVIGNGETA